jgi:parallel beta-helix repeat protein
MKNKIFFSIGLVLIFCGLAYAYSLTTNYSLYKPASGDTGWATLINNNFDTIDTQLKTNADAVALKASSSDMTTALAGKVSTSLLGAASGVATLGSDSKIPSAQLPDSLVGALTYKGVLDASDEEYPADPDQGDYYIISVEGTIELVAYTVGDWAVYNGTGWDKVDNTQAVTSVNGQDGVVVLDTGDIAEATDANYVSDAQLVVIGNTSGTNTGNQDLSGYAPLANPTFTGTATGTFSGNLTGNVTGNVSGTAATVTAAAQPAITSVGTLSGLTVSGTIAGNINTASALASNGANCTAGSYPLGVDTFGAVEGCTAVGSASISDTVYGAGWDGDTTVAPSKNAVYDKIQAISTATSPFVVVEGSQYTRTNSGIESALAALPAAGGLVYLTPGAYAITGDIDIDRNNVIIMGAGANTVLTLANATNVDVFSINGYDNITIRDLTIDGNKANNTTNGDGIDLSTGSTDFHAENLTIHDTVHGGVKSITPTRFKVLNSYFYDIGKAGVDPHTYGFAVSVYGTGSDIEIAGNTITNALGDGSIFVYGTDTSNRNENVRIHDNEISGIVTGDEKCCIQFVFGNNGTMTGNNCHDNLNDGTAPDYGNNGICSFNSSNVTISGNTVENVDGTGIEVYGDNHTVTGNVVKTAGFEQGYAGIYAGGLNNVVSGNKVTNSNVGLQCDGCRHSNFTGNTVINDTATTNTGVKAVANAGQAISNVMFVDNIIYGYTSSMQYAQQVLEVGGGTITDVTFRNKVGGAPSDDYAEWETFDNADITLDKQLYSGWAIKSAANTACSTTCVHGCNYGQDTGTGAIVACATNTADICLCKNGE